MAWNDNDDDYSYEDSDGVSPRVCRKCWDTYSNCDCEALRLKQALDEAKKEIKELKKLLKSKGSTTVPSTDPWIACGCPNPDDCEHIFRAPPDCGGCGGLGWIPAGDEQLGCIDCNGKGTIEPAPPDGAEVREAAEKKP